MVYKYCFFFSACLLTIVSCYPKIENEFIEFNKNSKVYTEVDSIFRKKYSVYLIFKNNPFHLNESDSCIILLSKNKVYKGVFKNSLKINIPDNILENKSSFSIGLIVLKSSKIYSIKDDIFVYKIVHKNLKNFYVQFYDAPLGQTLRIDANRSDLLEEGF